MPEMKSLTKFCAPNPSATPRIPAPVRIGATSTPTSARIVMTVMVLITPVVMLLSTEPMVSARSRRRLLAAGPRSASMPPAFVWARTRDTVPSVARRTSRLIIRTISQRTTKATTRITRIVAGRATRSS